MVTTYTTSLRCHMEEEDSAVRCDAVDGMGEMEEESSAVLIDAM